MAVEEVPNPSSRCKFLASVPKVTLSKCHPFQGKLPVSSPEAEKPASDFNEEEEVFVSAIINKYMESKCKCKSAIGIDTFKWALSPEGGYFMITPKAMQRRGSCGENRVEFLSAGSRLSRCSSDTRAFRCEGWPFGLCRRALLLPPLPKSPSDSWSWRKTGRIVKIHG